MKYIVMECHPGYAVVLDEEGRFLKVANLQYETGQTVTDVVEMEISQAAPQKKNKRKRWLCSAGGNGGLSGSSGGIDLTDRTDYLCICLYDD